jgi:hypothetical protein
MSDKRLFRVLFAVFLAVWGFAVIPYVRATFHGAWLATMLPVMNWVFFIGMAYLFYLVVLKHDHK